MVGRLNHQTTIIPVDRNELSLESALQELAVTTTRLFGICHYGLKTSADNSEKFVVPKNLRPFCVFFG
jgi:hypothetical protein